MHQPIRSRGGAYHGWSHLLRLLRVAEDGSELAVDLFLFGSLASSRRPCCGVVSATARGGRALAERKRFVRTRGREAGPAQYLGHVSHSMWLCCECY